MFVILFTILFGQIFLLDKYSWDIARSLASFGIIEQSYDSIFMAASLIGSWPFGIILFFLEFYVFGVIYLHRQRKHNEAVLERAKRTGSPVFVTDCLFTKISKGISQDAKKLNDLYNNIR